MVGKYRFAQVPTIVWFLVFSSCLLALLSKNPLYTIYSILFIPISIKLLWREGEPPVLFFSALHQWLSITIKVFYADINNLLFNDPKLHAFPNQIDKVFILSLIGLFSFILGVHLAIRGIPSMRITNLDTLTKNYNIRKVIIIYILFSLLNSFVFTNSLWESMGLLQVLAPIIQLKWGLLFFLCMLVITKNQYKKYLYVILAIEVAFGLTSFFSNFKDSIILFIIAIFTFGIKLKPKHTVLVVIGFFIFFNLAVLWTYSKSEYRTYISGGQRMQVVEVSKRDALNKFIEIAKTINFDKYKEAVESLIYRISYIDFFSACLDYVPRYVPFQNGKVWGDVVIHIFTPRIIFSDKPIIDDVIHLNKYTGLELVGAEAGTSIGLGYMGDSYIDFGYFMFIPIFLLGFFFGKIYKVLLVKSLNLLWGYAIILSLYYAVAIETSTKKIVGYLVAFLIVNYFLIRIFIPYIDRKLLNKKLLVPGQ